MLPIPEVKAPRLIKGATGPYWEYANSDDRTILLKFKFESMPYLHEGLVHQIEALQVNVLYFGPQFDLPEPWKLFESRTYVVDDKPVQGHIIGKFWVPLGEFQKAVHDMQTHVKNHVISVIETGLKPLIDAANVTPLMPLSELWGLLTDGLDKDKFRAVPKMLIGQQYVDYLASCKSAMAAKYEHE